MEHRRIAWKVACLAACAGLWSAEPARAAERIVLVGLAVDDAASGNADGSLEPGETADLQVELYNDGTTTATSVSGELLLPAPLPGVAILDALATWPPLPGRTVPRFSDAPHFRVRLDGFVGCGRVLPFVLRITTAAGTETLPLPLRIGRRIDHDTTQLPARSFSGPDTTLFGPNAGDALGVAVVTGDFNGDSYADMAMGAPDSDSWLNARPFAGEIYVLYGGADRRPDTDLVGTLPGFAAFFGTNSSDRLGTRLASGDIDGDGFDDLIIAAPGGAGPGNTRSSSGEAYLVYGQAASWGYVDLATAPPGIARIWGAEAGDGDDNQDSGTVELASGDLNGDGFDDIILGFDSAASLNNTRSGAGEVTILYGKAPRYGDVDLLTPPAGAVRLWGAGAGDYFGRSIATGDVDADGFDDLLIGAPEADSKGDARPDAGEAYLLRGGPAPWSDMDMALPPPAVTRLWGGEPSAFEQDGFGLPVAIGDLDGDGKGDLIVAATGADSAGHGRFNAGDVTIIFAPPAAGDLDLDTAASDVVHIWGADADDQLGGVQIERGEGLAVGDFNGDGHADLAAGAIGGDAAGNARAGAGEVAILYGPLTRTADVDLASPPPNVERFWGANAGDRLGGGMAAGDVDHDGLDDLVVGAFGSDSLNEGRADAGETYLWFGKPSDTYVAHDIPVVLPHDLGETVTTLPLQCDDCSTPVDLPFAFPFYGGTFSRLYVSSNGFLSFAPIDDPVSYFPQCFPFAGDQNLMIAPLWTDLDPTAAPGSIIRTRLRGIAPARRFYVEWIDLRHWSETGPSPSGATFWVVLSEATGGIQFHYLDVGFGSPADDGGRSAVVGLENRTGAQGLSFSCRAPDLLGPFASRALQFDPNVPLVESRFERQENLWEENPVVWHLNDLCAPASHTGTFGRYAGYTNRCGDGGTTFARLKLPATPDFPADTRVAFWSRRQVDPTVDQTTLDVSTMGPGFGTPTYYVTENSGQWRYEVGNLFSNDGDDVDLSFYYASPAASTPLGWMVDDVQVAGCDGAVDGPGNALALAFGSEPHALCGDTDPGPRLDAHGSYCLDLGVPASYQWLENGVLLPGETTPEYAAPSGKPAGSYDYAVSVECDDGAHAVSTPVHYDIEAPLGAIGDSLRVTTANNGATLVFTWDALPGAIGYELRQDGVASGSYPTVAGASPAGTLQIQMPMPAGNLFFLVDGVNSCGPGALD